jgi:hypothetical protein
VCCVLFECGVLFCVMCVICVLYIIVVPLPPGKNPLAVKMDNNDNYNICSSCSSLLWVLPAYSLFGCTPGLHIAPEKQVRRRKVRRTRRPRNLSSSSPLTREVHVQIVTNNVSKMNRYTVQLKNEIVVAVELRKSFISLPFYTLPVSLNCSCHLLMHLSSMVSRHTHV